MKSLTPWLAMLFAFTLIACGDDGSASNPRRDAAIIDGAPIDSTFEGSCQDSPPLACEEVVDSIDDCPSYDEVCEGVCGAAHECCYCGDDGQWQTLFTDCNQCLDAGNTDAL